MCFQQLLSPTHLSFFVLLTTYKTTNFVLYLSSNWVFLVLHRIYLLLKYIFSHIDYIWTFCKWQLTVYFFYSILIFLEFIYVDICSYSSLVFFIIICNFIVWTKHHFFYSLTYCWIFTIPSPKDFATKTLQLRVFTDAIISWEMLYRIDAVTNLWITKSI